MENANVNPNVRGTAATRREEEVKAVVRDNVVAKLRKENALLKHQVSSINMEETSKKSIVDNFL